MKYGFFSQECEREHNCFYQAMTPGIITRCASCAAPIPYTAPRCGRCHTRYCGSACQTQHWNEGGHSKEICKMIKRRSGAERFYADQKYNEAVTEAVESCAEYVPEGATCYICTESVVQRTGEGLVRGCAGGDRDGVASGMTGIAHVSCLMRQAQVVRDDELSHRSRQDKWKIWDTCSLCGHRYHGMVHCAMAWACWCTNLSLPERDEMRRVAMNSLAASLAYNDHQEDALPIHEAALDTVLHQYPTLQSDNP